MRIYFYLPNLKYRLSAFLIYINSVSCWTISLPGAQYGYDAMNFVWGFLRSLNSFVRGIIPGVHIIDNTCYWGKQSFGSLKKHLLHKNKEPSSSIVWPYIVYIYQYFSRPSINLWMITSLSAKYWYIDIPQNQYNNDYRFINLLYEKKK